MVSEKGIGKGGEVGMKIPPKLELDPSGAVKDLHPGPAFQGGLHKGQEGGNQDDGDYPAAETVMESVDSEFNEKGYGCGDARSSDEDQDGLKQISPISFDIGDDQS
jgi:hypothetical protein